MQKEFLTGEKMRELIFRGKRLDNGEWVQGANILTADAVNPQAVEMYIYASGEDLYTQEADTYGNLRKVTGKLYKVDPETVSQYTGLKDKNGTMIFEGDIVEFEDLGEEGYEYKEGFTFTNRAMVTLDFYRVELTNWYSDNSALCEDMKIYYEDFIYDFKYFKVIGNCHDNPELLEKE